MRIKIFANFCDSAMCKAHYERVCDIKQLANYGPDKALYLTTGEDYTHAIIINTAMPVLKNIGKEKVLGLAFEPPAFLKMTPEFIEYAKKYIGKYFIGCKTIELPDLFKEHYAYLWHISPLPLNYVPVKTRRMSIMVSEKKSAHGHRYRHTLVQNILSTGLPIDIYGRGTLEYKTKSIYKHDPRLKGEFTELEPYAHYDFHICIENCTTNVYFSEKITNALLCSSTPIYWGCTQIQGYFPGNVIMLTGTIEKDIALLRLILAAPEKYKTPVNVPLIKDQLNLLKNVDRLFS